MTRSAMVLGAMVAVAGLVGCNDATDDGGAAADDVTGQWQQVLTCDDGAAVIDRDTRSTMAGELQLVIRNADIVTYLQNNVHHAGSHEVIVSGFDEGAKEDARAFQSFEDDEHFDYQKNFNGTHVVRTVARVNREEGERVRVAFVEQTIDRACSGYIEEIYCRNGEWSQTVAEKPLADWGFQSCR